MTREEAIDIIKCLAWHTRPDEEDVEQAIKVLKQESCEDCISRQAVIDAIEDDNRNGNYSCFASNNDAECFKDVIRSLSSVTPKPKTNVLDEIRAEIEQTANDYEKSYDYRYVRGLWIALGIIDKHKAEKEEK